MKTKKIFYLLLTLTLVTFLTVGARKKPAEKESEVSIKPEDLTKASAPVELDKGVLFTYKDDRAQKVALAGNFNNWDANKNFLKKNKNNIWYIILPLKKGKIEYKFVVNNENWVKDPENKNSAPDGYGGENSIFEVKKEYDLGGVTIKDGKVIFKIYAPDAKKVVLSGSFNNWSTDKDVLQKDESGFWTITKILPDGIYEYKYIIDGNWTPDPMNDDTTDDGYGGKNSVVRVGEE